MKPSSTGLSYSVEPAPVVSNVDYDVEYTPNPHAMSENAVFSHFKYDKAKVDYDSDTGRIIESIRGEFFEYRFGGLASDGESGAVPQPVEEPPEVELDPENEIVQAILQVQQTDEVEEKSEEEEPEMREAG